MRLTRILVGLVGVFHGAWFVREGYVGSRTDESHVFPLVPWMPTALWLEATAIVVIIVGSACVALGFWVRATATLVALAFAAVLVSDWWAFHHSTFLAVNVFALLAWAGTKPGTSSYRAAGIALQILLFAVYVFAGLHKLVGEGFRSGMVVAETTTFVSRAIIDVFPAFVPLATWGTIVVELLLPFALLHPRTRLWAAVFGVGFHIAVLACTGRGPAFNMYLPALYPLFLGPDLARIEDWLVARAPWTRRVVDGIREPGLDNGGRA